MSTILSGKSAAYRGDTMTVKIIISTKGKEKRISVFLRQADADEHVRLLAKEGARSIQYDREIQ